MSDELTDLVYFLNLTATRALAMSPLALVSLLEKLQDAYEEWENLDYYDTPRGRI